MRYLNRPEPATYGPHTFSFDDFVRFLVNDESRFNSSGAGIRASMRIEEALKAGDPIELDQNDWQILREAAEAPSCGFPSLISADGKVVINLARLMLPFIDAITGAPDSKPKPEPTPAARKRLRKERR